MPPNFLGLTLVFWGECDDYAVGAVAHPLFDLLGAFVKDLLYPDRVIYRRAVFERTQLEIIVVGLSKDYLTILVFAPSIFTDSHQTFPSYFFTCVDLSGWPAFK